MALVRPTETFNSTLKSVPHGVILTPNDILSDTNPHVKAYPERFVEVSETFHGDTGVFEATDEPGRKRR